MRAFTLIALVGLAGCTAQPSDNQNIAANATAAITDAPAPENRSAGAVVRASAPLARYVGKYPFDKVDGASFLDLPIVRTAVAGAVPDAGIRDWIFEKAGPQAPIAMVDGKVAAWGCEAHNCGAHQWTVLIAADGADAEVCYLPDGAETPDWYAHGTKEARTDICPSGD